MARTLYTCSVSKVTVAGDGGTAIYLLTPCCKATATKTPNGVACSGCYALVDGCFDEPADSLPAFFHAFDAHRCPVPAECADEAMFKVEQYRDPSVDLTA